MFVLVAVASIVATVVSLCIEEMQFLAAISHRLFIIVCSVTIVMVVCAVV